MLRKQNTAAADSLQPHERAIEIFNNMNADQKRRHLATIQAMMGTEKINKEDFDLEVFDEQLNDCLESMGFNETNKQTAANLFFEAVEQRLFHEDDAFKQNLAELLSDYCPSPFISDEQINVIQLLANKIEELQEDIDYVHQESEELRQELAESLREETNILKPRSPRRSTINENLLEPDPDNEDALFNQQTKFVDAKMRTYLRAMGDDLDD